MSNETSSDREKVLKSRPLKRKNNFKGLSVATKVAKRRGVVRRTHSPKTIPSLTVLPPILKPYQADADDGESVKPSGINSNENFVEVRLLPPTVDGIAEAARLLRGTNAHPGVARGDGKVAPMNCDGGVVAFPSETVYMLGCKASDADGVRKLIYLKGQLDEKCSCCKYPITTKISDNMSMDPETFVNPPIVCIKSIKQVRGVIEFKPAKSYALVLPRTESEESSESLQNNNPVGVRRIDSSTSVSLSDSGSTADIGNGQPADDNSNDSTSRSSNLSAATNKPGTHILTRFSEGEVVLERLASAFWPGPLAIFVPARLEASFNGSQVLPSEILVRVKVGSQSLEKPFVGLRCPSHPLAQRLLKVAKTPVVTVVPAHKGDDHRVVCSTAAEIRMALQSCTRPQQEFDVENRKFVIPCIDGEDKREIFAVPTCEFGLPSTVVLVEEETRLVHVLRKGRNLTANDVKNALRKHHAKNVVSDEAERLRNQIVHAVLMKWSVVQHVE